LWEEVIFALNMGDVTENYLRQQRLWNVFVQAFFVVRGHPQKLQVKNSTKQNVSAQ
jgi:hypothetical protein